MAYNIDVQRAEQIIGYQFRDQDRLSEALEAATRVQEHTTGETIYSHDGNRRLAQLGHKVVELVLLDTWYGRGGGRGKYSSTTQD
jgi:dsRNA-specific ribonuclease